MTALTMPACAVPFASGHAYPIRSDMRGQAPTLMCQVPVLPDGFHWAVGDEVHEAYVLLDIPTIAQLLYASGLDPMAVGDHAVIAACHDQLAVSHGNTSRAQRVYTRDVYFDRESSEARLRACTIRADLLHKAEA